MMRLYGSIFWFFITISLTMAFAQNPLGAPLVVNYGKSVFQGGSRTWAMQQDSRGIMYFGNSEGLLTFDGKYWKQYQLPNQTMIRSIYISPDDKVYVGGQGEFGYFEKTSQSNLQYVSLQSKIPAAYRQYADVWHTVEFQQGIFFMASNFLFAYKGNQISVYPASMEWQFMEQVEGRLFAQDRSSGLLTFANDQWTVVTPSDHFANSKIAGLLPMGGDSILLSMENNKTFLLFQKRLTTFANADNRNIYTPSIAKIGNDRYVLATATEGCQIRDLKSGRLLERIGVTEGLQNKNVSTVFVDRQQNIWVAIDNAISVISYGGGIRYLRPNVEYDVTGYSTRIFENKIYLSSSNGVYVANLMNDVIDHSQSPSTFSLVHNSDGGEAWHLDEINGKLLLAHNKGIYNIEKNEARPIALGSGSWGSLPLSAVFPIKHSLVGTYHGLNLLTFDGKSFSITHTLQGTFDSYRFLAKDTDETIWASHPYRGIYRMRLNEEMTEYKTQLLTAKDGLPSTFQNYVFKVRNRVVFATEKGVYEFDAIKKKFIPSSYFTVFKNIPVKYLVDDKDGNIWFCSGKKVGVAHYHKNSNSYQVIYFPEIEGLNTAGFENIYPYDRHNIYIGSEKGIIHINYHKYQSNRSKPTVLLSSVVSKGVKDSTIYGGYTQEHTTILNATYDSYHFEYASPNYGIHEHVLYSYWLDGYDTEWSPWTVNNEKDYTNLPSGRYTFKIKAKNNLNEESEVATYEFEIQPPWYKSAWAYGIYVLMMAMLVYFTLIYQKKAWIKQQQKYERELQQLRYIHQLEVDKNEKEIVKLQNEKLEHEVLSKTKELASTSMQLMENSGALTKLRVELSKLASPEAGAELKRITSLLKDVENNTAHWDQFATHFDELNDGFFSRLKLSHPKLSRNDLKVCAYLRLNFTTKQIAQLQSISVRGVEIHRYRLRKKLQVPSEISLSEYLEKI